MSEEPTPSAGADTDTGSTYVAVTPRDRGDGKEVGKEGGERSAKWGSTRGRTRVRAQGSMVAADGAVTHGVRLRGVSWRRQKTAEEAAAPDIHAGKDGGPRDFLRDGPAPVADVVAYARSGAYARGEWHWLIELFVKWVQGYGIALIGTLLGGFIAWCSQRFHRWFIVAFVLTVLITSAPAWGDTDAQVPAPPTIGATP